MKNRIYLFANFGDWKKQPYGGGEVGNRRTLALLKKCDYEVRLIEKYKRVNNHSAFNLLLLLFKMIGNIFEFFFILLVGRRKKSIVHIVGFYGPMVYFEYALVSIAKVLGYKIIYEMRGGGADLYFKEGTERYRKFFASLIGKSDCIFSQGKENYPLIRTISKSKEIFYYPNYVMEDFLPAGYPQKPKDRIKLLYFGRVSRTKNVDIVIDVYEILAQKYDNLYLDIVGNSPEPDYAKYIQDRIYNGRFAERVKIHPACNHEILKQHLADKHFYIFPTAEPHEGHSNAMTEAMAWGLIPIATSQGFNKSVVANDDMIVSVLSPKAFADCISRIIDANLIGRYSMDAYQRVMDNYCSEKVFLNLRAKYDELFVNYNTNE